jgi:ferritin-like metal-binding protein YciE
LLGHIFGLGVKPAATEAGEADRLMQDLILACAVENSEAGMYQVLATMADAAGEGDTADLARDIQAQKHAAADKLRSLLPLIAGATEA